LNRSATWVHHVACERRGSRNHENDFACALANFDNDRSGPVLGLIARCELPLTRLEAFKAESPVCTREELERGLALAAIGQLLVDSVARLFVETF